MKYKKIADELNVSNATIRNWIKTGLISENEISDFSQAEIKKKIKLILKFKLLSRANKFSSKKTFIPVEYFSNSKNQYKFQVFYDFLNSSFSSKETENKLFLSAIYVSKLHNFFKKKDSIHLILENLKNKDLKNNIQIELSNWYSQINFQYSKNLEIIFDISFPEENDFLGILYQSLKSEGEKSKKGSYYTPKNIVDEIVSEYLNKDFKVLDPACGTGQFLLAFASKIINPKMIYGFDNDPIAVKIARINLILKYKDKKFTPNIFVQNSLLEKKKEFLKSFDFIATNPPWGAKYQQNIISEIKNNFDEIKSKESFSFFIVQAYRFLKKDGIMSFVLPESISNVKTHKDIRYFVLQNTEIQRIDILGKCFKNVLSSVISIQLRKNKVQNSEILVTNNREKYTIEQQRFAENKHTIFDIHVTPFDYQIFSKIFKKKHFTLEGKADWALGIVTGDNKKFIQTKSQNQNSESIFKGADVDLFLLKKASNYIVFEPEKFQQVASIEKYRAKEKLVYKFISKNLVFAYDDKKSLTLNSANILIPKVEGYSIKLILGFLNSKLYNFYFKKKFNSIKILRGDIEQLPIPVLTDVQKQKIESIVSNIIIKKQEIKDLDLAIYDFFEISQDEREYIEMFL